MHRASFAAAGMHGACGSSLGHHWVIVRPSIVGPSLGHRWVVVGSSLGWCMVLRHPHGCMGPLGYVGPSWGHHWVIVGSSSGHPWVIIFGSLLGHRWVIIFGSLLGHRWVILGMVYGPEAPPQLYGSDARPTHGHPPRASWGHHFWVIVGSSLGHHWDGVWARGTPTAVWGS